jgi:Xaa-Pro aminopeptidase
MYSILCESRVFKNDEEIAVMKIASQATSEAHV